MMSKGWGEGLKHSSHPTLLLPLQRVHHEVFIDPVLRFSGSLEDSMQYRSILINISADLISVTWNTELMGPRVCVSLGAIHRTPCG